MSTTLEPILQQLSALELSDELKPSGVEFVHVPYDKKKSIKTVFLTAKKESCDAIPEFVKPFFASDKTRIDESILREQARKQCSELAQNSGASLDNISVAAMNAVASQGSVETFPLVRPTETNDFTGVYIYLDEVGLLKKLPNNIRATEIAVQCGYHPPPQFYGDVFIGRVQTKPVMKNVDFSASKDMHGNSTWMKRALQENLAWQEEMNRITSKKSGSASANKANNYAKSSFIWTQDDDELEITVPIHVDTFDKTKVKVIFFQKSIKIIYDGKEIQLLELQDKVDTDGCTWTVEKGNVTNLVLTCEKANQGIPWPRLVE